MNIVYLCIIVASILFAIKVYKKFSALNQKVSALHQETVFANKTLSNLSQEIRLQIPLSVAREELVKFLKVYTAYDQNGPLKLVRHGKTYDGGYVTAVKAFEEADVLLGYGIDLDNSFEDQFSIIYNKPSYGFDCGIEHIDSKSNLFTLVRECIGSDAFLYNISNTNGKISSFEQQLDKLKLRDKKIFIKMDIEGAEYDAFPGIIKNKNNITGITLEIHFTDLESTKKALSLLKQLDKDFVLIHVHGNNCCVHSGFATVNSIGVIPNVIELSYINRSLVTHVELSADQSHPLDIDQPNIQGAPEATFKILD